MFLCAFLHRASVGTYYDGRKLANEVSILFYRITITVPYQINLKFLVISKLLYIITNTILFILYYYSRNNTLAIITSHILTLIH